jgi:hypothetical protein
MDPLYELYCVTERRALEFFFIGLKDVSGSGVDERELLYVASVLAHYSQVSTATTDGWPTPANLTVFFDNFVWDNSLYGDSDVLETAGMQCLLLSGFFETQMRQRHSIRWYSELGTGLFRRSASLSKTRKRGEILDLVGRHFEPWRERCSRLSGELRDSRYIIRVQ